MTKRRTILLTAAPFLAVASSPWDHDDSNAVDFGDILAVQANWGPCPSGR